MSRDVAVELPLEIEAEELASWRGDGRPLTVLDVRERWETQICMIAGSVTIPLGNLPQSLDRLSGEAPVVVVCHHGTRSLHATAWLRRNGFANVTNLRGGIDAWARRIEPNMSSY